MTGEARDPDDREQQWALVLAECLEALESGTVADRQALLGRHPEFAADLQDYFAQDDHLDQLAAPIRAVLQSARPGIADTPIPDGRTLPEAMGAGPGLEGRRFGDYELREWIATGGMGQVYKARQHKLNRVVALKMIRADHLASASDRQRFQHEAEAAAGLDHPHIVPIYDVGTQDGQPFFSMKLIEGGSLAGRLGHLPADLRADVQRIILVARAIHHAHQHGVLHRDLKPSNVLLDAAGQPYVTDFGLAKRVASDRGVTQTGEIVGTPSYMAPEQATQRVEAITTAADVYGLGAILYALLTGRPPFKGESVLDTLDQVRRRPPERPSRLNPRVDRDLETICLKCLEKEPRHRYSSAEELAKDLERWLNREPVRARPVRRRERVWRWCRRKPFAAAALVGTALGVMTLLVSAILIWQGRREVSRHLQRVSSLLAQTRANDQLLARLAKQLAAFPHTERAQRQLLEAVIQSYEGFLQEDSTDPEVRQEMGKVQLRVGEVYNDLGEFGKAEVAYQRAETIFQQLVAENPARPDLRQDLARSYEGPNWNGLDKPQEAELVYRKVREIRTKLAEEFPSEPAYRHELAVTYRKLGETSSLNGRRPEAEEAYRQSLDLLERLLKDHPEPPAYRSALAQTLVQLGRLLADNRQYPEAEQLLGRSRRITQELVEAFGDDPAYRNELTGNYFFSGVILAQSGQPQKAAEFLRQARQGADQLVADFPTIPEYRVWQAHVARELGRASGQAELEEQSYRKALEIYEQLAKECPVPWLWNRLSRINISQLHGDLGDWYLLRHRDPEAEEAYSRMRDVCEQALADYPRDRLLRNNLAAAYGHLSSLRKAAGRLEEAIALQGQALPLWEGLAHDWPNDAMVRKNVAAFHLQRAVLLWLAGRSAEAAAENQQGRALFEAHLARDPNAGDLNLLAWHLAGAPASELRDPARAVVLANDALKQAAENNWFSWRVLAVAHYRLGEWRATLREIETCLNIRQSHDDLDVLYLAMAHWQAGNKDRARWFFENCLRGDPDNPKAPPKDPELRLLWEEASALLANKPGN